MATYDNPRTEVVHWVEEIGGFFSAASVKAGMPWPKMTACHFLRVLPKSKDFDPLGESKDVTCSKCAETADFLEASQKAFDAAVRDGTKARCFRLSCEAQEDE